MGDEPGGRRTFDFEVEIATYPITGRYTAENGVVTEIELEDGTVYRSSALMQPLSISIRRAIAREVLHQLEGSDHYRSLTEQTAPIESWASHAPTVL